MPPRFKELYKQTRSSKDSRQNRLLQEAQLRRLQREQVFMGKRLRLRNPQDSETESEYEFTASDMTGIIKGLEAKQPSEELREFVLEGKCIELLIGFLTQADGDEKLQSLWCLTNIAASEGRLAERVLPATPHLLPLLSSDIAELTNQAAWALGNLAAEGEQMREQLYALGALAPLVSLLGTQDPVVLQTACFAVSNMARKPCSYFSRLFELDVPQVAAKQLKRFANDPECVAELAWVFAYLTAASSAQQVDCVLASGAVDVLLQCAVDAADGAPGALLIPIIRTLGNVAAGTDAQTHALVTKPGFVALLVKYIESRASRAVEKETLWVLSSVTAGRKEDVHAMVNASVVPDLVRIIETQDYDIKKEAAFSLLNIALVGECLEDLPNERLVREFVGFLRSQDPQLVRMGVQFIALVADDLDGGLGVLRRVEGAIDALENLVAVTEDDDTRAMVSALIDRYYGEDAEAAIVQ
ncbi:hypothetical protein GGF37_002438 [Kickxella alabastrina]|nr:hypothetical protein GGF37_002438 [Kickxella alabastrina]